jgi:hypothetical protein
MDGKNVFLESGRYLENISSNRLKMEGSYCADEE